MRTIAIESPYAPLEHTTTEDHVQYARLAVLDCLNRGEAPWASHLLYTQVWDDLIPTQRAAGIAAGLSISDRLEGAAIYYDLGISPGMTKAVAHYRDRGIRPELRRLFTSQLGQAIRAGEITCKKAMALI